MHITHNGVFLVSVIVTKWRMSLCECVCAVYTGQRAAVQKHTWVIAAINSRYAPRASNNHNISCCIFIPNYTPSRQQTLYIFIRHAEDKTLPIVRTVSLRK